MAKGKNLAAFVKQAKADAAAAKVQALTDAERQAEIGALQGRVAAFEKNRLRFGAALLAAEKAKNSDLVDASKHLLEQNLIERRRVVAKIRILGGKVTDASD